MKKNTKVILGLGLFTAAAAFAAGVVHELKVIKKLTTDIDELPEEEVATEETVTENPAEESAEAE